MSLADHTSVTQVRFQPTLFLYLGTSAGQIGYRLKRLLKLAYGDVPVLRHLWIDIDIAIDPLAQPWFTDAERIELSGLDPAAVVQNIDNFPAIKAWWPDTTRLSAGMLAGGGSPQQMRLIGGDVPPRRSDPFQIGTGHLFAPIRRDPRQELQQSVHCCAARDRASRAPS